MSRPIKTTLFVFPLALAVACQSAAAGPIQQSAGDTPISIDAADFDSRQERDGMQWVEVSPAGATGTGALQALPNRGISINGNIAVRSPRVDYQVNFTRAGTYYIWVRGYGPTDKDGSLHVGLDGVAVKSANSIQAGTISFGWTQQTRNRAIATLEVPSAGVHTVNVFMREDGFILDKLVLVPDAAYAPTGAGPAPSPREEAGTTTPPTNSIPSASPDFAATTEGMPVTIAVLANDTGLNDVPLTVRVTEQPGNGTAREEPDNRITYTPNAWFSGADSFMYSVTDADGDRAIANVSVDVACVSCADKVQLRVGWAANVDKVDGYRVYTGPTSTAVTNQVADLPLASGAIDPAAPAVTFSAAGDLGLRLGDQACFRVSAYNEYGESEPSAPTCVGI